MSGVADLREQVEGFAVGVSATVQAVLGDSEVSLVAALLGDRFTITAQDKRGIMLTAGGEPLLDLLVRFDCDWDLPRQFMAVSRAEFKVYAHGENQPLFRYEFDKAAYDTVPTAHVQVHAHRDAFTWVMTRAGRRSKRARARAAETRKVPAMQEIHFPLGGRRFRPALEDVLQMLVEEFGLDAAENWRELLADGRERWRRGQVKASVRDAPEEAAQALRGLGYAVAAPANAEPVSAGVLRQY